MGACTFGRWGGSKYLSVMVRSGDRKVLILNPNADPELLEKVSRRLPFYEKEIDEVILTSGSEKDLDPLQHFDIKNVLVAQRISLGR